MVAPLVSVDLVRPHLACEVEAEPTRPRARLDGTRRPATADGHCAGATISRDDVPPTSTARESPPRSSLHLLRGPCRYYHYGCDGTRDHGWGCGYRTLQTILSWLHLRRSDPSSSRARTSPSSLSVTSSPPSSPSPAAAAASAAGPVDPGASAEPTLREIQTVLATANAGKRGTSGFVGSTDWISTEDVFIYLSAVHRVQCRVLSLAADRGARGGAGLSNGDAARALAAHFDRGDGPVMIGGVEDNRSRACLGVYLGDTPESSRLLILDPHYGGRLDDCAGAVGSDGALTARGLGVLDEHYRWEPLDSLDPGSWYNLCCPAPSLGLDDDLDLDLHAGAVPGTRAGATRAHTATAVDRGLGYAEAEQFEIVVESSGFGG